jgi:putative flippase GtrA
MLGLLRARLTLEQRRFAKFCVVGASGVVVNLAFVWLGQSLFSGLEPKQRDLVASLLGILVSVFGNFLLNNQWTWRDRTKGADPRDLWRRVVRYYLASGAAIAIQFFTAQGLLHGLGWNIFIGQTAGIILGTAVNYMANNSWTFRKSTEDPLEG